MTGTHFISRTRTRSSTAWGWRFIVGCRNVVTDDQEFQFDYSGKIDRDVVICDPIEVLRINDDDEVSFVSKKMQIAFLLAVGVKYDKSLKNLIDEVYGQ